MVDFARVLKTKVVDIAPPPVLPVGTYRCRVGTYKTLVKQIQNEDKGIVSFGMSVLEALGDVDEDAIKEYGGNDKLKKHKLKHDIFLGDEDEDGNVNCNAVKTFATDVCKVDNEDENLGLEELLAETNGATVLVSIQHKPRTGKGQTGVFAVVAAVIADEE